MGGLASILASLLSLLMGWTPASGSVCDLSCWLRQGHSDCRAGASGAAGQPLNMSMPGMDMGNTGKALEVVQDLKDLSKRRYFPAYEMALAYIGLGDRERAFEWLEKAYKERSLQPAFMRFDPALDNLRLDPRFQDLMRRVGLPP